MTESSKRFAWINIWMMAFSAGTWLFYPMMLKIDRYWAFETIAPLALVFVVGLLRRPFNDGTATVRRLTLGDMSRLYLDALREVFRRKWILWLFGSILALTVLAGCTNSWLEYTRFADQIRVLHNAPWRLRIPHDWMFVLPIQLMSAVSLSLGRFLPSTGLGTDGVAGFLPPVILLVLVIWLSRRLGTATYETQDARHAELIRKALFPVALASAACMILLAIQQVAFMSQATLSGFRPSTGLMVASMVGGGIGIVLRALFTGAVIAGLGGSLLRMKLGETVTTGPFRQDVVRYLVPVTGVYLLLTGVYFLFYVVEGIPAMVVLARSNYHSTWPLAVGRAVQDFIDALYILAMFAPFAVIIRETGAWQGIKAGMRDWAAHAWDVICFAALGISFMSAVLTASNLCSSMLHGYSLDMDLVMPPLSVTWLRIAIDSTFRVLVSAVMAVAVWEFYWRISRSSERA